MSSNAGYFIAAYVIAAVVYGGYALSLRVRDRALAAREAALDGARRGSPS